MTAKAELSIKSTTDGKAFAALADRTKPGGIKVGFVKGLGKHPGSNATIAEIAAYNEFGTDTIPERPFLRTTLAEQLHAVYLPLKRKLLEQVLNGEITIKQAIGILGEKAAWDVKAKIDAISQPPNAESTKLQKKGVDNPLVDTGLMKQSVSWELVK